MRKIEINPPFIKLEQFIKFANHVSSGGEAKIKIQSGEVAVNGEVCTMRGRKLFGGEKVTIENQSYEVIVK